MLFFMVAMELIRRKARARSDASVLHEPRICVTTQHITVAVPYKKITYETNQNITMLLSLFYNIKAFIFDTKVIRYYLALDLTLHFNTRKYCRLLGL